MNASFLQQRHELAPRACSQSVCDEVDYQLPSDWICNSDAQCISLNTGSTAICCPYSDTANCTDIAPVTCDLQAMNNTLHPDALIKTTWFVGGQLATCGNACCPHGYDCVDYDGPAFCNMNFGQSSMQYGVGCRDVSSSSQSPTTSTSSQTTAAQKTGNTSKSTAASTNTESPATTLTEASSTPIETLSITTPPSMPVASLSTGVKAGIGVGAAVVALAIISAIAFWALRRNKQYDPASQVAHESYEPQDQEIVYSQHELPNDEVPPDSRMSELSADLLSDRTRVSELPGDVSWYTSTSRDR